MMAAVMGGVPAVMGGVPAVMGGVPAGKQFIGVRGVGGARTRQVIQGGAGLTTLFDKAASD